MSDRADRPTPRTLTGTVELRAVAAGSKSEQTTVVLVTAGRPWLLRRPGSPPMGIDPELAALAGHTVEVVGIEGVGAFLATTWRIVPPPD